MPDTAFWRLWSTVASFVLICRPAAVNILGIGSAGSIKSVSAVSVGLLRAFLFVFVRCHVFAMEWRDINSLDDSAPEKICRRGYHRSSYWTMAKNATTVYVSAFAAISAKLSGQSVSDRQYATTRRYTRFNALCWYQLDLVFVH